MPNIFDENLLEAAGVFGWKSDLLADTFIAGDNFETSFGIPASSIFSFSNYLNLVLPVFRTRQLNLYNDVSSEPGKIGKSVYRIRIDSGKLFEITETVKCNFCNEKTKLLQALCIVREVSETTEEISSRDFLMGATLDPNDYTIKSVNSTFLSRTGYSKEELIGKTFVSTGLCEENFLGDLAKLDDTNNYLSKPGLHIRLKDGRNLNVYSAFEKDNANGEEAVKFFGIDLSIIAILNSMSNDFFRILENSPSTIVVTDRNAIIEYVNPKFTKLTGFHLNEVIGRKTSLLKSGYQTKEFYNDLWNSLLTKGYWEGEFNNVRKDGSNFWERARISNIKGSGGQITRFIKFGEDVTEKKESEIAITIENRILSKVHLFDTIEEQLTWILGAITEIIELESGSIILCNDKNIPHEYCFSNLTEEEREYFLKITSDNNLRELLLEGKTLFTKISELTSFTQEKLANTSLKACSILPVAVNNKLNGAVFLLTEKSSFIHEHLRQILGRIQPFVAHTILLAKEHEIANKSQLDLSLAFSSVDAGTWVYKVKEDILELKEIHNWEDLLGYKSTDVPEISIRAWLTLVHEEDKRRCSDAFNESISNKEDYKVEYRFLHSSGKWIWLSAHGRVTRVDSDGNALEMHGIIYDISSVKEKEAKLREAQNIAKMGNWEYDILHDKLTWSDEVFRIFEMKPDPYDFTSEKFFDHIHPEDREKVQMAYNDAVESQTNYEVTHRILLKSGVVKYVNERCYNEYSADGTPLFSNGIVIDITESELAKQQLELSEQKFRLLTENTRDGLFIFETGRITYMSPAYKKMMGYNPDAKDELQDLLAIAHPEDLDKVSQQIYGSIAQRKPEVIFQFRARKADGTYLWREDSAKFLYDDRGIYKRAHIIARDISKQKAVERKLVEANIEKSALLNALPDILFVFNRSGEILLFHSSVDSKTYIPPDKFVYKTVHDMMPAELAEDVLNHISETLETRKVRIYSHKMIIGGEERHFDTRMVYVDSERAMAIVRDITDNVKLTTELIKAKEEAEKSEILKSEFLAQMSHEIRTPVGAIMSYSQILREYIDPNLPDIASIYEGIERSGKRIIRTINLILNTSEIETGSYDFHPVKLDLKDNIFKPLSAEFKYLAELKKLSFGIDIPDNIKIFVDEYSFMQIFGNLIDNALKYTERGFVKINAVLLPDNKVEITVSDSGIGISKKYIPELFNAFSQEETGYSRKFEGTGLGLKLVKEYCRMNRTEITVESIKGKGSKFIVTLPVL